jgi:transposase
LHKLLEDAGIKLATVASDVLGVSGRAMIEALISGQGDPEVLAELARGKLRQKLPALRQALLGRFSGHHALLASHMLSHVDDLDHSIDGLSEEIAERLRPFATELDLLQTITGVGLRSAEVMLAELGADMSRFPTDRHCASWVKLSPGNDESAGKRRSGKTGKGNPWLRATLIECARAATRSRDGYLKAQYLRLRRRRGDKKAIVAVAHSILVITYHVLKDGRPYNDLGGDWFERRERPDLLVRRLTRQLERLGHRVTLEPIPTQEAA